MNDTKLEKADNTKFKIEKSNLISLLVCLGIYMAFCFGCGVQICADSGGYIRMISAREPVYPLFLALNRKIFGEGIYLWIVVIIQNLLMTFAVWKSAVFLKKQFELKEYAVYAMIAMHVGVAALCQFAAGRSSIYPNSILTEGLTTSLWIVFMVLLWKAMLSKNLKDVILPVLLVALMMDTRKQMAVGYITLFGTLFFGYIKQKKYFLRLLAVIGMIIVSVLLAICGTRLYNLALRGEFAQNTRDMNLVLTTSLYVADKEDADLIEEPVVRELFIKTMDILDEKQCNYSYAKKGWRNLEAHYVSIMTKSQLIRQVHYL